MSHPAYRTPEQLAVLLGHAAQHVTCEPQERFGHDVVRGNARALYKALGSRLGEPGHQGDEEES